MTVNEFVSYVKNKYPEYNPHLLSDEAVYNLGKRLEPETSVEHFRNKTLPTRQQYTTFPSQNDYRKADISPKAFQDHEDGLNRVLQYGIDEESAAWKKSAVNNSTAGLAYQLYNGKPVYDLDDYNPGLMEEFGSFMLSMVFPTDLALLGAGSKVGQIGAKMLIKESTEEIGKQIIKEGGKKIIRKKGVSPLYAKGLQKRFLVQTANRNLVKNLSPKYMSQFSDQIADIALAGAVRSGTQFGVYEGVRGNIQGRIEGLTGADLFKRTWDNFSHGLFMGALAGYGGGFLGAKWQKIGKNLREKIAKGVKLTPEEAKLFAKSEATFRRNAVKMGYEVGVFTSPTIKNEWQGLLSLQADSWAQLRNDMILNTAMVGTFKGVSAVVDSASTKLATFKESLKNDIIRRNETDKALNSVKQKLELAKEGAEGMDAIAYENALAELEMQRKKTTKDYEKTNENVDIVEQQLIESSESIKKLTQKSTPDEVTSYVDKFAKALKALNEYIGLTGDKEIAMRVNKFSSEVLNSLMSKVIPVMKNKKQLANLYMKIRGAGGKRSNVILVERGGKPKKLHLGKDIKKITASEIIKAIESERKNLNRGSAENSIKDIENNNRVEDYSSTEDFRRGYSVDEKGSPSVPNHLSKTNQRNSKNKNKFSKQEGRNPEITDRANKLTSSHEKVSKDTGGADISYTSRESYIQSRSIILNAIETFFLNKLNKSGTAYKSIKSTITSINKLRKFSKWLAVEKKKNLYEVHNKDVMEYLREKGNKRDADVLFEFYEANKKNVKDFSTEKASLNIDLFEPYSLLKPKPKTTAFEKASRVEENKLKKKFDFSDEQVRDFREEVTGIRKHKDMNLAQQKKFNKAIKKLLSEPYEGANNQIRGSEIRIKMRAKVLNFSKKSLERTLKAFGVKDGKFKNVRSVDTLRQIENFLSDGVSRNIKTTNSDALYFLENDKIFQSKTGKFPGAVKRFLSMLPSWYLIREKVSKSIYNAIVSSEFMMERIVGSGLNHTVAIKKILPKRSDRDMLRFIDKSNRREAKSAKEKQFIKDLDKSGDIILDGKKISVKEGELISADAIFEGGSKAWQASMVHRQFLDKIFKMQLQAIKYSARNKTDYIKKRNMLKRKYLNDYMTRVVNPEVLRSFYSKNGSIQPWFREHINKILTKEAGSKALEKGLKKGSKDYKEFVKNYKTQERIDKIRDKVSNMLFYDINRLNPNVLKERSLLLGDAEGNIIIEGFGGRKKKVKAYISDYDGIMGYYSKSMSKSISATMFFPEFTKLGMGGKRPLGSKQLEAIFERTPGGDYTLGIIRKHLGLNENMNPKWKKDAISAINTVNNTVISLGLSIPGWHGLKNFAIGQARNVGAFGLMNTTWGLLSVFSRATRERARESGWIQQGIRSLEFDKNLLAQNLKNVPILKHANMKNLFRYWNLMEPFEYLNRVSSGVAGRLFFEQSIRTYKGQSTILTDGGYSQRQEVRRYLKDRLKFSEKEIEYIDRFSLDELLNDKKGMEYLRAKAASQSHLSTQGGTAAGMLPAWMSSPLAKPLTIFYRIAAHATFDTYINFIKPIKTHANPYPLARLILAHSVSGMGLYWAMKNIYGQDNPFAGVDVSKLSDEDTNSLALRKINMYATMSGIWGVWDFIGHPTKGIFSGSENLIDIKGGFDSISEGTPALISMGTNLKENAYDIFFKRPKGMSQAEWTKNRLTNFFKESTSLGGMLEKQVERFTNPFMRDRRKIRASFRTYLQGIGKDKTFQDGETKELTVMMNDLKRTFTSLSSTEDDKIKAVMVVYNVLVMEEMEKGVKGFVAHKNAAKRIKSSVSFLKPIHKNMGDGITDSDIADFYRTLTPEYQDMLRNNDAEATKLKSYIQSILSNRVLLNRYSILGGVGNMKDVDIAPHNKILQKHFYDSLDDEDKKLYKTYRILY